MITTTMRRLVSGELITPVKLLGKHEWLRWKPNNTSPPSTRVELNIPTDPTTWRT